MRTTAASQTAADLAAGEAYAEGHTLCVSQGFPDLRIRTQNVRNRSYARTMTDGDIPWEPPLLYIGGWRMA
jgi:hypothetical protein